MGKYIPNSRPQITKEETEKIVRHYFGASVPKLVLIGVRGYYSKTMGATEGNDINLYDDAMLVWGLDTFKTYNANTDPSFVKARGRGLAMLNTGIYNFYKGKHKGKYSALRAFPEGIVLPCTREGKPATCSHINIHKGGTNPSSAGVTWSEGCTTIPTPQWTEFIEEVYLKMTRNSLKTVPYILIDNAQLKSIVG